MPIVHSKGGNCRNAAVMKKYIWLCALFTVVCILTVTIYQDAAYAMSSEDLANVGVGADLGTFNDTLKNITKGLIISARVVAVIMTAVAGCMVAFGIQDGTKTTWNIILGIGLALNFGSFLYGVYSGYLDTSSTTTAVTQYQFDLKDSKDGGVDVLSGFMNNYTQNIIIPGAKAIVPISIKLLIILTLIDASLKLAFDLVSGDKVKFLLKVTLQSGFYLFLITNWLSGLDLMQALSNGFEGIGFVAGGSSADTVLKPDSIVNNAIDMFTAVWKNAKFSITNLGLSFIDLISLVVIMICLFLTAIEMFMARIEFYTMALITIPLLAFGACDKTKFLSEKAIGAMFNLAVKVCVISFISTMACPMLKGFADKFEAASQTAGFFTKVNLILQAVLISFILVMITKKIPALVQGLLSGQPSLGGSDMTNMGMAAAKGAGGAMGAVRTASNMAGGGNAQMAAAAENGTAVPSMMSRMGGTAKNLATLAYLQNPMTRGFQEAAGNLRGQMYSRGENRSAAPANTRRQNPISFAGKTAASATKMAANKISDLTNKKK